MRGYIWRMKIGYGYNRDPYALRQAGAERVWIDTKGSNRMERADLFAAGLRRGSTLILLSRSDLGVGKEIHRFEALAEQIGATIEIHEPQKPSRLKPGPAPAFQPTPEQRARIAHYWHGPFKASEALRQASKIMGREVNRNQLNRALGPRGKATKEPK